MSSETKFQFFELGDRTALICADSGTTDFVKGLLSDLGFKYHAAGTPELALERLRYTAYDCIILHENFAGTSLHANAVLNHLSTLPMSQRRNSFVCLVGPSFTTLDAMQAFAQSVHLVVNPDDVPNFEPILKRGLAEFEQLYRVFKETVAEKV